MERFLSKKTIKLLHEDATHYLTKYHKNPNSMRQAATFLLSLLRIEKEYGFSEYDDDIEKISKHLYRDLDKMEIQFELGEALSALQMNNPNVEQQKVLDTKLKDLREPENVFELNWHAQFLKSRRNMKIPCSDSEEQKYKNLLKLLHNFIEKFSKNIETNYLAVAFEAYSALTHNKNESTLTFLFNKLMERCDVDRGLFMFNDGSARIDISGHVYRGMINLIK